MSNKKLTPAEEQKRLEEMKKMPAPKTQRKAVQDVNANRKKNPAK